MHVLIGLLLGKVVYEAIKDKRFVDALFVLVAYLAYLIETGRI